MQLIPRIYQGSRDQPRMIALVRVQPQENLHNVVVETDNYRNAAFALYEAAGFRVSQNVLVYRKDYANPATN